MVVHRIHADAAYCRTDANDTSTLWNCQGAIWWHTTAAGTVRIIDCTATRKPRIDSVMHEMLDLTFNKASVLTTNQGVPNQLETP